MKKRTITAIGKKTTSKNSQGQKKHYRFATIVSIIMFLAMVILNALFSYFITNRGCLCPMCLDCYCGCGTVALFKEYFFYYPAWAAILMMTIIAFVCCIPTSRYLKWLRIIPFVILGIIFILIIRGLYVIL